MAKVEYQKAIRKQVAMGVTCFLIIIILGFKLFPLNELSRVLAFVTLTSGIAGMCFWSINKFGKSALCPNCKSDLFTSINGAKEAKIKFNYCPSCGAEIEI